MARTPYSDPEAEQAYQDIASNSSKPSVGVRDAMDKNDYNPNRLGQEGWEREQDRATQGEQNQRRAKERGWK